MVHTADRQFVVTQSKGLRYQPNARRLRKRDIKIWTIVLEHRISPRSAITLPVREGFENIDND